jgi:hypothetical protein
VIPERGAAIVAFNVVTSKQGRYQQTHKALKARVSKTQ